MIWVQKNQDGRMITLGQWRVLVSHCKGCTT